MTELQEIKVILQSIPVKGEGVLLLAEAMLRIEKLIQKEKENETTIPIASE